MPLDMPESRGDKLPDELQGQGDHLPTSSVQPPALEGQVFPGAERTHAAGS